MTLTATAAKHVRRTIEQAPSPAEACAELIAECDRIAARVRSANARMKALPAVKAPGATPEQKRAEHRASTGDLRAQVWERCGGRCEVSGSELGAAWEMHHVQGAGLRRSAQRLGNVLAVSWDVHRLIHRGDLDTLKAVAACPTLDAEGRRAAEHRILKIAEARRER